MKDRLVAHRGLVERGHTENTVAALSEAVRANVAGVEFDVRRTRDHRWILHHDATLDRIHGVSATIADRSLAELRELAPVEELEAALGCFDGACVPFVEIKESTPGDLDRLTEALERQARIGPVIAICRGEHMPTAVAEATSDAVSVFLYTRDWNEAMRRVDEPIVGFDLPWFSFEDFPFEQYMERFAECSRDVAIWTVNQPEAARSWCDRGARWIISDRPLAIGETS